MHGTELWKSDGTAAGTVLVNDINANNGIRLSYYGSKFVSINGTLFFSAPDPITRTPEYPQGRPAFWNFDDTTSTAIILKDFPEGIQQLTDVNGTLFFMGDDGTGLTGPQIWKSDGTVRGTLEVSDFPENENSYVNNLTSVGNLLFFTARDDIHGNELWKSDGTTAGTVMVKDINTDYAGMRSYGYYLPPVFLTRSSNPSNLTNIGGTLYFIANDTRNSIQLWKSDGTADGTIMLSDVDYIQNSLSFSPSNFTNVDGTIYFFANDSSAYQSLWKTDGTPAGTVMVADFHSNILPNDGLISAGGKLFFTAYSSMVGQQLWTTDGTASGTVALAVISPDPFFLGATVLNDSLLFTVYDGANDSALWTTDGTLGGTVKLADFNTDLGENTIDLGESVNLNGTLLFTADDSVHGDELWKTDGTAAGTAMVVDINPGVNGSFPSGLTDTNNTLFFWANDGIHGIELWKSDGTTANTSIVADINPGSGSSYPSYLTNINGKLFFEADASGGSEGANLYYLAPQLIPGDFNGDGHVDAADLGAAMQAMTNPTAYEAQYNVSDADLNTIGDVNGDGQFNAFDLQRLLILLKTGGGSTEQESVETEQTPTANNPSFATQSAIPSADLGTFSTVEDTSPPANSAQSAASVQAPNDASQPTNNVATSSTADTPTPLADSPLSGNSPISISQESDSINLSDATNLTVSFGSRSVEPLRVKAAEQTSSEKLASKTANSYLTADSAPDAVVLATVDQTLLDYGDDFRRHLLRQSNPQIAADDSFLSELFASWTKA